MQNSFTITVFIIVIVSIFKLRMCAMEWK